MPSQLIYPAVEGDGNEYSTKVREKIDKDYFQNRFDTIESQVVTILKSVAPLENPVRIDTARDWFTYQLKTFNWLNLGVVLVLFFSLQMIQHQTASNQSTLLGIKKQELVLLAQQDELKNSVTLAQYQVENVTKTNTEFFFKAHKAMADLHTANLSSTAHLYSLYETMVTNLQQLNQSSYKLFEEARERVGHSMKQTIIKSGSGNFTLSTNPSPLYIKIRMAGGGGGGSASGSSWTNFGTAGGETTFGKSLLVAYGGEAGRADLSSMGGTGSVATSSTVTGLVIRGGSLAGPEQQLSGSAGSSGKQGGTNPFGGNGGDGGDRSGSPNSGAGGAGGSLLGSTFSGCSGNVYLGISGNAGGYIEAVISSPRRWYQYTIGAGGLGGQPSGSNCGVAGGNGGSGVIIIEEYFA